MLNHKEISERFFSLFTNLNRSELADLLEVGPTSISTWRMNHSKIPWSKLEYAVNNKDVSWDWLLTGKGGETKNPSTNQTEGQGIIQRLYATLEEAHGALSDISVEVNNNRLPADMGLQAVEEALDTLLKVHGKAAKEGKRRHSKTDTRDTGKTSKD